VDRQLQTRCNHGFSLPLTGIRTNGRHKEEHKEEAEGRGQRRRRRRRRSTRTESKMFALIKSSIDVVESLRTVWRSVSCAASGSLASTASSSSCMLEMLVEGD
jgi:hypothetical protein